MSEKFKQQIKQWIVKKKTELTLADIDDDLALIEERILDSMMIVDLILYMEHLRKKPVDIDKINPASFQSVNDIVIHFFDDID